MPLLFVTVSKCNFAFNQSWFLKNQICQITANMCLIRRIVLTTHTCQMLEFDILVFDCFHIKTQQLELLWLTDQASSLYKNSFSAKLRKQTVNTLKCKQTLQL